MESTFAKLSFFIWLRLTWQCGQSRCQAQNYRAFFVFCRSYVVFRKKKNGYYVVTRYTKYDIRYTIKAAGYRLEQSLKIADPALPWLGFLFLKRASLRKLLFCHSREQTVSKVAGIHKMKTNKTRRITMNNEQPFDFFRAGEQWTEVMLQKIPEKRRWLRWIKE